MKHLGTFACLMLALMAVAFATSQVTTDRYVNWDRFTVTMTEELYGTTTVTLPAIFGTLRLLNYNNTGGSDMNVSLYNDAGTLIYNATVAPGGTIAQRDTLNSTILGAATATFIGKFNNGTSLATATLYCAIDTSNVTNACATGGANLSWGNDSTIVAGKFNNATTLDGINDVLTYANTTALNFSGSNGATLSFWAKMSSPVNNSYLWHQGSAANDSVVRLSKGINNTGVYVTVDNTGSWNVTYISNRAGGVQSVTYNATSQLTDNTWHHYTFTSNNTTIELYIDAVKVANTTFSTSAVNASTNSFRFGDGANNLTSTVNAVNYTYTSIGIDEMYGFQSLLNQANVSYLYSASRRNSGFMTLVMRQ